MGTQPQLQLSGRFSPEQREAAQRIWAPILQRLSPLLANVTRLECSDTPNGLIAESAEGWTLAMCSLGEKRLPHVVSVRHDRGEAVPGLQALLTGEAYSLRDHPEGAADLHTLLKAVLRRLGARRVSESASSSRERSPRRAAPKRPAQRLAIS